MLLPISWLKEYIDIDIPIKNLADILTMAGFEVEEIKEDEISKDIIFNFKITSNRGDCLSVIGIVRELQALLKKEMNKPIVNFKEEDDDIKKYIEIEIKEPKLCPRYSARIVQDVKVSPSPEWLKKRLLLSGIRPLNNIVDITNYVCLELGQPMHAFDYSLIRGKKIIVRCAKKDEKLVTLDEKERVLSSEDLIIADKEGPIAIAGVIGGKESEIKDSTNMIVLESANFLATHVRRTAKRYGLKTESSYRFERGVDISGTVLALDKAVSLIKETSGGKICKGVVDIYPNTFSETEIKFRPNRCRLVLGIDIKDDDIKNILNSLALKVLEKKEYFKIKIPTYRRDLNLEEDLIEEVARIYGYDNIKPTLPIVKTSVGKQNPILDLEDKLRNILTSFGLYEVITHSLTDDSMNGLFNLKEEN